MLMMVDVYTHNTHTRISLMFGDYSNNAVQCNADNFSAIIKRVDVHAGSTYNKVRGHVKPAAPSAYTRRH